MKPVNFDLKLSKYFDISINFNSRQIALLRATGYNGSGSLITDGHDFVFNVFIQKSDDITAFWAFFQFTLLMPIFWLNKTPRASSMDDPAFKNSM